MNHIDGRARTVRELLTGRKYGIDYYQREYRWQTKQIQELLEDLTGKFLERYEEGHERSAVQEYEHYFLGSIVLSSKNNLHYIIDGQQRLTSLSLLLIHLEQLQRARTERVHIADLIFSERYGKRSFNLDVPERTACMEAIFSGTAFDASDAPASVRTIVARYDDIRDFFPDELVGDALPFFIDWLLENVHLIEIVAYSDADAYTIFETMNDRGLSLSLPDMLKGYLLSNISDANTQTRCNDLWKRRVLELAELGKDGDVDFFKTWLRAQHARTIREGKRNAPPGDYERIGTEFHRWVREKRDSLELIGSQNYVDFVERHFQFYSRHYLRVRHAAKRPQAGIESIFYNAWRGFTLQFPLLLAPLHVDDAPEVVDRKLALVAGFIDIVLARRVWNFKSISYSNMVRWTFSVTRAIRGADVPTLSATLLERLAAEPRFAHNDDLRRHHQNNFQVHLTLARMTAWLEAECGVASTFAQYVERDAKKPYEIEHLWAKKYERHSDEFGHRHDFERYRDRIGGLVLLPRGFNQSLGDKPYEEKLEHYNAQNLLVRSLNPACYRNNPSFQTFLGRSELPFQPHENFKKADLDQRQVLYRKIAEQIWSIDRLRVAEAPR